MYHSAISSHILTNSSDIFDDEIIQTVHLSLSGNETKRCPGIILTFPIQQQRSLHLYGPFQVPQFNITQRPRAAMQAAVRVFGQEGLRL